MSYTDYDFPHTNMYGSDLREIIANMRKLEEIVATFVSNNTIEFADPIQWNITTQYRKSVVVLDENGNAFLSKEPVPAGIELSNERYWLDIFNFMNYVKSFNSNLTYNVETNTERATDSYLVGDWLIWNDILYKVTAIINLDDLLVIGTNIERFTVEEFCRAWQTYMVNTINQYKTDIDASELAYKNEIDASEAAYRAQLASDIESTTASLQAQLNAAISGATVDSEVINARIGANDVTYSTLGEAIRTQISNCNRADENFYNGLYDGYMYPVLSFEQGWINSSGQYSNNDGTKHIIKPFEMSSDYFEVINNTDVDVYVIYFTAFTSFANFTYARSSYVPHNGGHVTIDHSYTHFAVELLTYDHSDMENVVIVKNSKLDYLSSRNIDTISANIRKELYNGYMIDKVPWEHGWISSNGTYNPNSPYYISHPQAMDSDYVEVYNGSNTNIYLCYLSTFVNYSDFTYDSFVTIGVGGKWTINQSKAFFFIGVPSTDGDQLPLIELRKLSNLEYLSRVNIGELPDYWQTYLNNKKHTLKWADMSIGRNGVSFAFVTDVHIDANNMMSPKLLYWLTRHTNVRDVICGGDIVEGYNTAEHASDELFQWMQDTSEIKIVNIHGNHDNNTNGQTDPTQNLDNIHFYALECRQSEYFVTFVDNEMYGYSDNADQKMRYIYLDTGAPDSEVISNTQINWMKDRIEELDSGWFVVIFCHQFFTGAAASTPTLELDDSGVKIKNALEDIYDTIDATIVCVVSGHCHRDYSIVSSKGFPMIATTCDTNQAAPYDPVTPDRTAGTTEEQAFDIFYINTSLRTIDIIRIGAGDTTSDRSFTF